MNGAPAQDMPTFIFAGGGTGGHLYPGLAIAAEIRAAAKMPVRTVFVCSDRPLDREILEKARVEFVASPARPMSVRLTAAIKFCRAWGVAVRQSRRLIRQYRGENGSEPVMVVAMGGFVAAPAAQAARVENVPLTLVNLDAVPGKANRWIAQRTDSIFSATRLRGGNSAGITFVPPIVRGAAIATGAKSDCRRRLGLAPDAPVLMVTGGSQGARSINDFMVAFAASDMGQHALKVDPEAAGRPAWQILHQTGKDADTAVAEAYKKAGLRAVVRPFADAMGDWWGAAELAIARSGAGNVAEVWANKVPTIFMPYPFHKDEHQRYNAQELETAGGVRVVRDQVEAARNIETAGPVLRELLDEHELRKQMWAALEKLGPANGAAQIARSLLEVVTPAAGYAR